MNKLFKALKVGALTDETMITIEMEYKQIQQQINDIVALPATDQPPRGTEKDKDEPDESKKDAAKINYKFLTEKL
jgi:hypothetical protein